MLLNNLTFQHNDYKEVGLDLFQSKPLLRQEFIFHNFCYSFNSGITTLVAKNGVGKSTLIQCIVDEYILSLKNNGSGRSEERRVGKEC